MNQRPRSNDMRDAPDDLVSVRVPEKLAAAIGSLREATGRDDYDIVTSALRTYLADARQREAVVSHFYVTPTGYPAAYVVTACASLQDGTNFDADAKSRAGVTFGQINRYRPTRLEWGSDGTSVVIQMAVSGQTPDQAATTAVKMVRNRIVEELRLAKDEALTVAVTETYDLLYG
jgi:hypothetical protein